MDESIYRVGSRAIAGNTINDRPPVCRVSHTPGRILLLRTPGACFQSLGRWAVKKGNIMKIMLDNGAKIPTRAHSTDAGLDLYAMDTQIIPAKESAVFDTGVHIELPECTAGFLKSKSGLNTKHGITSEGVIDVGYTGSIVAKLYNHSGTDYKVNAGDKITQLVIVPILTPELELVESLGETERGNKGFGSTGK